MAEHASDYMPGQMDIRQNQASFDLFVKMAKWGSLFVAEILIFFTSWICTGAGFFGALFLAAIVLALGILLLREKPDAAAH